MTYMNYMCINIFWLPIYSLSSVFKYLHKMMIIIVALIDSYSIVHGIKVNAYLEVE